MDALLTALRKKFGSVIPNEVEHSAPPSYLRTGILPLDYILGGGLPRGHITQVFGPEGSGKSGLMVSPMLMAISEPVYNGVTLYIATEPKVNTELLYRLGVPEDKLVIVRTYNKDKVLTGEMAFGIVREAAGEVDFIVVDSIAGMIPDVMYQADIGKANFGAIANLLSQQLGMVSNVLATTKTALALINQERANVTTTQHARQYKPFGGYALKYWPAKTLRLASYNRKDDGMQVVARLEKASFGPSVGDAEWKVDFKNGVDRAFAAYEFGCAVGVINARNRKLTLPDGEVVNLCYDDGPSNREQAQERMRAEPELLKLVETTALAAQ